MNRIPIHDVSSDAEAFAPPPEAPEPELEQPDFDEPDHVAIGVPPSTDAVNSVSLVVELDRIGESPSNPRQRFDGLVALAESIRAVGILQAPVVRRVADSDTYEIVVGHRRVRAAKMIGLKEIPVEVRELTDEQVLAAQVVENDQRESLHPLELATGLQELHTKHGWSIEKLADRIGKKRASVYASLKLLDLGARAQQLFLSGKLSASTALLVARIPDEKLQLEAAKVIAEGRFERGPMSVREAEELVRKEYMLDLKGCPFDPADGELVASAGACASCPKRTGAQPDLFKDVPTDVDLCTDPACYRSKVDADWKAKEAAAKAGTGPAVVSSSESARIFNGNHLRPDAGYVEADSQCADDMKWRSYRQLLGRGAKAHSVLAKTPEGQVVELVPKKGLKGLLDDAGLIKRPARDEAEPSGAEAKAEKEAEKKKAEVAEAARKIALSLLVSAAEEREPDIKFWRLLATILSDSAEETPARRGFEEDWRKKALPKMDVAALRGLVLELAVEQFKNTEAFALACDLYRIDLKEAKSQAKAEMKAAKT